MPIYVYGCESCEHTWEHLTLAPSTDAPENCPKCGKASPKKKMTAARHTFRGSGIADGIGGWEMNKHGTLQRVVDGENSVRYGE